MSKQISKKQYNEILQEINTIGKNYNLEGVSKEADNYLTEISNFSIKLLFVGRTKAGKSSFINSLLGRGEFLKEEQAPETSIATEIVYDQDEHVALINNSGDIAKSSYDRIYEYNPDDCNHYEYHINNEYVKKLSPFTMVDMPGTESEIERHTNAILRYICQGNAYILVINSVDGTIIDSVSNFINEFKQYDNNMGIVVTRSEGKPNIEEVRAGIEEKAQMLFGKKVVTIAASKFDDNKNKFNAIIDSFDSQNLFEQKFKPALYKTANLCLAGIESAKAAMRLDDNEIKQEIDKREKQKANIQNEFEEKSAKLSKKMKNYAQPQILSDVQNALHGNIDTLAACAVGNSANFSQLVNNILRPVFVTSTNRYVDECFNEFIGDFDFSKIFSDEDAVKMAKDVGERIGQFTNLLDKIVKTGDDNNKVYKAITGTLAIATSVVAPWLEIIIFFLPEIIKGLKAIFGKKPEDEAKVKIQTEIIPQILAKLEPKIEESLSEFKQERISEIQAEFNKLLDIETAALEEAVTARANKKVEYDWQMSVIDSDITKLRDIRSALEV